MQVMPAGSTLEETLLHLLLLGYTSGIMLLKLTSGKSYVAYCFAEKQGYSKIGSYIGNGNANGTFVYTGFKPAWVMCKKQLQPLIGIYMIINEKVII
jgi:hypothetical protein